MQAVLFTTSGLASGPHTLTIEATGTRNAASADNIIVVDAFDITGASSDTHASNGDDHDAKRRDDRVWRRPGDGERRGQHRRGRRAVLRGRRAGRCGRHGVAVFDQHGTTTTVTDGSHTLTAMARDGAGNTTTSAAVTVTVSNASPPPTLDGDAFRGDGSVDRLHAGDGGSRTAGGLVARQQEQSVDARDRLLQPVRRGARDVHLHRDLGDVDRLPRALGRHRPRVRGRHVRHRARLVPDG